MVVSVVVGFRNISISIWCGCLIMSKSRKLMVLLYSCVGVNCRLGCVLFMVLWISSGVVCFALCIIRISSTYLE